VPLLALSKLIIGSLRDDKRIFETHRKWSNGGAVFVWLMICIVGSANRRDAPRANQREGRDTAGAFGDDESQAFSNWLTTYHQLLSRAAMGFST
jgi:hypothetical protein